MAQISIIQTPFWGQKKKKKQSKTVLMIRLMDRVHNSLPSYILKIEKYYGIWPESIVSVSLHHRYFRTNLSIQSPNLYLTSNMASLQHTFLKALIILMVSFSLSGRIVASQSSTAPGRDAPSVIWEIILD